MSMSFAFILRNSHRPTCPWANATDISIRWAADAWYFVHSAAALLAFTAFAIACIAIVGIKSVDCARPAIGKQVRVNNMPSKCSGLTGVAGVAGGVARTAALDRPGSRTKPKVIQFLVQNFIVFLIKMPMMPARGTMMVMLWFASAAADKHTRFWKTRLRPNPARQRMNC